MRNVMFAIRIANGKRHKTAELSVPPSVCLSVCPVDRQQKRRPAGLLLSAGAGSTARESDCREIRHRHVLRTRYRQETATLMGVNATGTLGGRRSSAEDARIEAP